MAEFPRTLLASVEDDWDKFPILLPYLSRNENPLSKAIQSNDVKFAVELIKNDGVGINGGVGDYPWPIHMAVQDNNKEACQLLLRYNCEVNRGDEEGDAPLHLASSDIVGMEIFEDLLAAGASVNQQTNMGETPLLLAAQFGEMGKLERLLQEPNVDVHVCDCHGNSVLHNLLSPSKNTSEELIKRIKLLMERNIDINAQNKEGYTPLMSSAFSRRIECGIFLLRAGANPFLKDRQGNTFLHHVSRRFSRELTELDKFFLDVIQTCADCHIQPALLLNVKNLQGDTPFSLAVTSRSKQVVEICIDYGANVNSQNNLGQSCLYEAMDSHLAEKVDLLLERGADIKLTNVKGESVLHIGYDVDFLRKVLEKKGDCLVNARDSNGLTPLHHWVFSDRTEDVDVLVQNGADVNIRDDFGSTPLHFAAWHSSSTVSKFLETQGADPLLEDAMGHRPSDITYKNKETRPGFPLFPKLAETIKNEYTGKSLSDTDAHNDEDDIDEPDSSSENEYAGKSLSHTNADSDEDDIDKPDSSSENEYTGKSLSHTNADSDEDDIDEPDSSSEECFIPRAVDTEDATTSVPELLNSTVYGMVQWEGEALQVKQDVIRLLEKTLSIVKNLDGRFAATLFNTGSSSEGTLVSHPHEFDFICYLDNFSSICTVYDEYFRQIDGYSQAKLKDFEQYESYSEFFEGNRMLDAELVRNKMKSLFRIAFHQGEVWKDTRLYLEEMSDLADKPTINVIVRWVGCRYKNLEISIDIVPALRFPGYWPSLIDAGSINLMTEDIYTAGCALLLQHPDFNACRIDDDDTFLRISAAPAEVALFRTLPTSVKRSYALAKILLQRDICPPRRFSKERSETVAGDLISSYMLKTSLQYVLDEQPDLLESARDQGASNDYSFVKELTTKIFLYLRTKTCCRSLKPYFLNSLENTDIFSFEYKEYLDSSDISCATEKNWGRRKYFLELIIQILNKLVHSSNS